MKRFPRLLVWMLAGGCVVGTTQSFLYPHYCAVRTFLLIGVGASLGLIAELYLAGADDPLQDSLA